MYQTNHSSFLLLIEIDVFGVTKRGLFRGIGIRALAYLAAFAFCLFSLSSLNILSQSFFDSSGLSYLIPYFVNIASRVAVKVPFVDVFDCDFGLFIEFCSCF